MSGICALMTELRTLLILLLYHAFDLNMHCISAEFMPKIVTAKQKAHCVKICEDHCQQVLDETTYHWG